MVIISLNTILVKVIYFSLFEFPSFSLFEFSTFSLSERKSCKKKQTNLQFDRLSRLIINTPCFKSAYFSADRRMAVNASKAELMRTLFRRRFIFFSIPALITKECRLEWQDFSNLYHRSSGTLGALLVLFLHKKSTQSFQKGNYCNQDCRLKSKQS